MPTDPLIYVVDDNEAVRNSLLLLLERGCTVRGFASAPQFLAAAQACARVA